MNEILPPLGQDLSALHEQHHAQLRELLFETLERMVAVDVDAARLVFGRFVRELHQGMALEEEVILPCYRQHGPTQGPGKPEIVDGDHVILLRGIDSVCELLAGPAALRPILEGLPHLYRLIGTLDHHTERERRHVYPLVVLHLDPATQTRVVVALQRLVGLVDDGTAH